MAVIKVDRFITPLITSPDSVVRRSGQGTARVEIRWNINIGLLLENGASGRGYWQYAKMQQVQVGHNFGI